MSNKKIAAIGLAAGLGAGTLMGFAFGVPGFAGAQSTTTAPSTDTTTATADDTDRDSWLQDVLDDLVAKGTIDQGQADAVRDAIVAARPERGPGGRHGRGPGLEAAATALGMTEDELHTALHDGQTIAEIAASKNIEVQTVIDAMVNTAKLELAQKVSDGTLTQAEADERLADITERVTAMVNGEMPAGGPGGRHGGRGPWGGADDADDAQAETQALSA
jgi:polyhydroxyalkanoate synthesis regulator phasin